MRRTWLALLTLTALAGCGDTARSPLKPLLNRCTQTFECNTGDSCDTELGICTRMSATDPYDYRVQVTVEPSADAGQLAPFTTEVQSLRGTTQLGKLTVQRAVRASGRVIGGDGSSIEAELVLTPRGNNALGGAVSVFTRTVEGVQTYQAQLEPGRTYDVLIYPRGPSSERYPPASFELPMSVSDVNQDFSYAPQVELSGQIRDETNAPPPAGLRIKVRWRDRLLASSSIGVLDAQGSFRVYAPQSVIDAPAQHELALDLSEVVAPQNVQIAFDMSKRRLDGLWIMPVLPQPVQFIGSVEISAFSNLPATQSNIDAQLTWVSNFEPPPENVDVRQRDWCKLKLPGAPQDTFRCSAYVTTAVGADLRFSVRLLPGDYQLLVAPTGIFPTVLRVATASFEESISSQQTGVQEGRAFRLAPAVQFDGMVRSPSNKGMPAVTVTADALGIRDDLPEVALYNRSDRQSSDERGFFRLAVDIGIYDLIATPPEGSGYAWVLTQNRRIDGMSALRPPRIEVAPQVPVIARGEVVNAQGTGVANAKVDAYALVPDLSGGQSRAVRVARTRTNSEGRFALQLPPKIGESADSITDAGVPAEAAAPDAQR